MENIEQIHKRPPNDIDLVTFFYIPDGYNGPVLLQRYPGLFNPEFVKYHYAMDAYFVELNQSRIEESIEQALYLVQSLVAYAHGALERLLASGFDPRP